MASGGTRRPRGYGALLKRHADTVARAHVGRTYADLCKGVRKCSKLLVKRAPGVNLPRQRQSKYGITFEP